MEEKIHIDEYDGSKIITLYDDEGKELYKKYPSGADGDFIEESIYNEKKQLISKVCYLAYEISEFGTEALEDTFYKEYTFEGKKEGFWLGEFARENYVNGKKVYEYYGGDEKWFKYDANGKLIHTEDSDGNEKIYEYDFSNNLIRIKNMTETKNQLSETQCFLDNQNCLWIPNNLDEFSEDEINQLSQINENAQNKNASLYLNHSNLMDKFENPDVILPNNIETFYYRINFRNRIKRIYIPASVKKIVISPSSDFYVEEHSVEFIVSEKNENFVSANGSIYTKDFKTLIYAAQKKGVPFLIDSRCEEIADSCKLFVDKKLYFDTTSSNITPNLKTINFRGLISNKDTLKIPEGVETLKKGFWYITKFCAKPTLYVPSTVKKIEKNCTSKYKISKKNKTYASYKNDLYSTDFKTFYAGQKKNLKLKNGCEEVYLSDTECEKLVLPKSVKNIFELDSTMENIRFVVSKKNPYFSEYMGSLYTKDFETLLFLHLQENGNFHDIHIHPNCKKIHENAGIKKGKTKIGKVFPGNLFTSEEQIENFKQQIFENSQTKQQLFEIRDFTMEKFRNSIKDENVRFGLAGIEIHKNTVFSDNFQLLNHKKDEVKTTEPCFYQKEDFEEAKDFFQDDWNGIPIDCKIADIIEKLNKQNYKTKYCCSGHILHHERLTSNTKYIGGILTRKPFGTICQGYIYFDCIPKYFKKIFPKEPIENTKKLYEMLEDSYTNPVFFFNSDKKFNNSFLRFYYKNSIQEQNKTFEILKEKLAQLGIDLS